MYQRTVFGFSENGSFYMVIIKHELSLFILPAYGYKQLHLNLSINGLKHEYYPCIIRGIKKKWDFSKINPKSKVTLSYELKVNVQEYAKNHIAQEENIKEIEQLLTKKLQ